VKRVRIKGECWDNDGIIFIKKIKTAPRFL
jgi:hypothetical protein